jgi:hypothetical protein
VVLRTYIYLHLLAVALTGLVAYWDRVGLPSGPWQFDIYLGLLSVYLIPVFPIVAMFVLAAHRLDRSQQAFVVLVAILATITHAIAALPLIQ